MKPDLFVTLMNPHMTAEDLDFLHFQHLHPELYFTSTDADTLGAEQIECLRQAMQARGFRPILHAPFYDLNPGAHDAKIRAVVQERLLWIIDTAKRLEASQIVLHPGYGHWVLVRAFPSWFERAKPVLAAIVARAGESGVRLAFENIYDPDPADLHTLLNAFPEPHVGFCFDVGHFNLFSQVSMRTWLDTLGARLFECHLHDNLGSEDDHIALGDGCIKFGPLIHWLRGLPSVPRLTLEMEQRTHIIKSAPRVREWFAPPADSER